jgi:hypothetical protein
MIEILEIPVITLVADAESENDFEQVIQGDLDRNYDGFRHIEKALNSEKSVYFYLLDNTVEKNDFAIWDRIIPKSAFCLVLFDWHHTDFDRVISTYRDRYQTPIIFVTFSAPPNSQKITSQILKEGEIRVIFAEKKSDEGIESILAQAILFSYPEIAQ